MFSIFKANLLHNVVVVCIFMKFFCQIIRANMDLVQYIVLKINRFAASPGGYLRLTFNDAKRDRNQMFR